MDTDYETFASVYSCMEGQPAVPPLANGWVLTREQDPPGEVVQRGLEAFRRRGIDTSLMEKIQQVGILNHK